MGGGAVVGVERVCDFCVRVLFLIPVQLWGVHVWCRDAWQACFCCGFTFFYPHRIGGVCGVGSGVFPFSRVDFFLPASWVGSLCVVGCVCDFMYAGIIFSTRAVVGCVCGVGSGPLFPILQVDFFLPASWVGARW